MKIALESYKVFWWLDIRGPRAWMSMAQCLNKCVGKGLYTKENDIFCPSVLVRFISSANHMLEADWLRGMPGKVAEESLPCDLGFVPLSWRYLPGRAQHLAVLCYTMSAE